MNYKSILIAIAIIAVSCKSEKNNEVIQASFAMSDKMLSTTKTAVAKMEQIKTELSLYGKITADNNKMIEVYPVVGGNVTQVFVELGDYVKKGQLLAIIRSTEVAGFEKELDDAQSDLMLAKKNLKVAQELYEGKLNTEKDVLEAKSHMEKAQSQLLRIQETYQIYNMKKGAIYEVLSPLNGFVIQKNINQDMLLRNDHSDNIFDIAEIDEVWVMANVNESNINLVKEGINAEITTLSYPDKIFYGKVDKIYNIIDPETKAMKIRIKLPNHEYLLKPEMRANIKLSYTENQQLIAIPSAAVIFDKSKTFVMIFKDRNNIETRQVEIVQQTGETSYILSGLKEGEQVMTENQLLVYDALND